MNRTLALLAAASLLSAQAGSAVAADGAAPVKSPASACSSTKAVKASKATRIANVCQSDDHDRTVGFVFAGAVVAGVIAIAVSTNHNHITASP